MTKKPTEPAKILQYLEIVAPILPTPVYWEDINSTILGANPLVLNAVGFSSFDQYVGKSLYDIYSKLRIRLPKDIHDALIS